MVGEGGGGGGRDWFVWRKVHSWLGSWFSSFSPLFLIGRSDCLSGIFQFYTRLFKLAFGCSDRNCICEPIQLSTKTLNIKHCQEISLVNFKGISQLKIYCEDDVTHFWRWIFKRWLNHMMAYYMGLYGTEGKWFPWYEIKSYINHKR